MTCSSLTLNDAQGRLKPHVGNTYCIDTTSLYDYHGSSNVIKAHNSWRKVFISTRKYTVKYWILKNKVYSPIRKLLWELWVLARILWFDILTKSSFWHNRHKCSWDIQSLNVANCTDDYDGSGYSALLSYANIYL